MWNKVENTHEPLVCDEVWQAVQKINQASKKNSENCQTPRPSLLSKLLVCADCNATFEINTSKSFKKDGSFNMYTAYRCKQYQKTGGAVCSRHRISETSLAQIVLESIKNIQT